MPMTILIAIGGIWIAINAALFVLLLMRRDQPGARDKLMAWVLKGERRAPMILKRSRIWFAKRRQMRT
jgi:hypothetical protein